MDCKSYCKIIIIIIIIISPPPLLACNLSLTYVVLVHNVITCIYTVLCL
jgi:hypothetical protein